MADIFGDHELFLEFEKVRPASDEILMQKIDASLTQRVVSKNNLTTDSTCSVRNGAEIGVGDNTGVKRIDIESSGYFKDSHAESTDSPQNLDYIRKLEQDVCQLTKLNAHLMRQNRLINTERFAKSGSGPLLQVVFMNSTVARRYRTEIESFVASLIESDGHKSATPFGRLPVLPRRPNYVYLGSSNTPLVNGEACDAFTAVGACQYYNVFIVDTVGWPLVEYNPSLSDGWQIPAYEQVYTEPLPCEDEENKEPSLIIDRPKRMARTCFNCGGDHNLSDCKTKLDHRRVTENRREFNRQKQSHSPSMNSQQKVGRYHADDDPRFAGLKAGVISDTLRQALGISANQLPPYIYQMRRLGYPPGHLENARHQTSGLSMFGKYGLEVNTTGEMLEDGEVNEDRVPKVTYDVSKFVEYPGFNIAVQPDTIDEWERFKMLPMQQHHAKDVMQQCLGFTTSNATGTKRRSSGRPDVDVREKIPRCGTMTSAADDMELDDSVVPDDPASLIVTSEPPTESIETIASPDESSQEPDEGDFFITVEETAATEESAVTEDTASAPSTPASTVATPVGYCGSSVSFTLGTPIESCILDLEDPESDVVVAIPKSLPDRSLFTVGVSDHILYENLPNATGTYKRLREVIRTIHGSRSSPGTPPGSADR